MEEKPFYFGEHYLYNGFWYYCKFPVEWAMSHLPSTGPKECDNCAYYGTVHDGTIFVGYCLNCAKHDYLLTRGPGLPTQSLLPIQYLGNEIRPEDIPRLLCEEASEEAETQDQNQNQDHVSILECHYEGGYNDY
jgi:hypothetical protein